MDGKKENNHEYLKTTPEFLALQKMLPDFSWLGNLLKPLPSLSMSHQLKTSLEWTNNLKKSFEFSRELYNIFENIQNELAERNIDVEIIGELELSEILKLYNLSGKMGLSFADLAEDSLRISGEVKYEQAVAYLESLNKRKEQIVKNDLKNFNIEDNVIENLKSREDSVAYHIMLKIKAYEKGEFDLTEQEKNLLSALKKNTFLTNMELAEILGYSVRNIEEICRKIREKFEIDFDDNKLAKRRFLVNLAKNITL